MHFATEFESCLEHLAWRQLIFLGYYVQGTLANNLHLQTDSKTL